MNLNDEISEPVTTELGLGYCYHAIHGSLNNTPGAGAGAGAGANAVFRTNITLLAKANPLSELVWSPTLGLSHVILSPLHARRSEENLIKYLTPALDVKTGLGIGRNLNKTQRGDDSIMSLRGSSHDHVTGTKKQEKMEAETNTMPVELRRSTSPDERKDDAAPNEPLNEHTTGREIDNCIGAQASRMEIILASEFNPTSECNLPNAILHNTEIPSAEHRNYVKGTGSDGALPMEQMEVTAENNLQTTFDRNVCGNYSPTNSSAQEYRRKGKAKALSDGNAGEKPSNEDDDSHESIESCNSARVFSNGKRKWNFDRQLVVVSKRGKTSETAESPSSTSNMKQDSSFMNWIQNMMKGFLKSNQDEPVDGNINHDQDIVAYNKNQDPRSSNAGFQSLFQSLYRKTAVEETRILGSYNHEEPEACHGEDENSRELLPSNEKFGDFTSPTQQKVFSASIVACQENSSGNKGMDFNPSLEEQASPEKIDFKLQPEGMMAHNAYYRNGTVGNLWITRFAPKTSGPSSNLDSHSKNCGNPTPYSQDFAGPSKNHKILPIKQIHIEDPNNAAERELQNSREIPEASINFSRIEVSSEQKSLNKLNHIMHTPRLKISEAMASIFAKRLDALKHIMPLEAADNTACTVFTCLYCGRKGHHLKDCSEVTDMELEDLLRNINASKRIEEMNCFCIRCFQHDHWAATCPLASTHKVYARNDSEMESGFDLNQKLNENSSEKLRDSDIRFITSSSRKSKNIDNPKGVFDCVKMLRLSRIDILKWIASETPLSHLDGFYLRLKLGKWQEGGTGYCVAYINETQRETSLLASHSSIYVGVGGMNCFVESQYISNQDFLEDELNAWWDATLKRRGEVPSEESLISKLKERKMLGI